MKMSFDKKYKNRKDYKRNKNYHDSRDIDITCRCHGGCPYCEGNRFNKEKENIRVAEEKIEEYYESEF